MKSRRTILIIFSIVLLVVASISFWYVFRSSDTSVEKQNVDVEMSASELITSFESNEQEANNLYLGKVLRVNGTLNDISVEQDAVSLTLKEEGHMSGIICSFDPASVNAGSLQTGQPITVKGICTGYLLDVVMNKCSVVE